MPIDNDLIHDFGDLSAEERLEMEEIMDAFPMPEMDDDAWMRANEDVWRGSALFDSFEDDELPW
jgi:hypothetical protein